MLQHLSVQNYALIDTLDLQFDKQLTIITGETGAGKSILLGALGLVAGNRADTGVLRDKSKKCIVEAQFSIADYPLREFFEEYELDYEQLTTIRREISASGTSRAFINDTPVNLAQLKQLTSFLIDIHSQHQTLELNNSVFQLGVVDSAAGSKAEVEAYQSLYKEFRTMATELKELEVKEAKAKQESDYLQFQFNELHEAELEENEQEALEQQLNILNNAESIKTKITRVLYGLNETDAAVVPSLASLRLLLNELSPFGKELESIANRTNSLLIELKDIVGELENAQDAIQFDPGQLEKVNDRLDLLYRLQQKHRVKSVPELVSIKNSLEDKLGDFSSLEEKISKLKKNLENLENTLEKKAGELSKKRSATLPKVKKSVEATLADLGMPGAVLQIAQAPVAELNLYGKDAIEFLFSANKGSAPQNISKVASGGELSRLMLSIKALLSGTRKLPSILFDEIDTGVSGEVANKVGLILSKMAGGMQVIAITHLPQIASKGTTHLFVYKEEKDKITHTRVRKLSKEERITEIAKMLSTENPTAAAVKNAKELLAG